MTISLLIETLKAKMVYLLDLRKNGLQINYRKNGSTIASNKNGIWNKTESKNKNNFIKVPPAVDFIKQKLLILDLTN